MMNRLRSGTPIRMVGRPIHVLYVDDEHDFADRTVTVLERANSSFTIETATTASDGLDRIAEDGYDCIISEFDLPGMNGIEFLKIVREEYPDLPFLLFTGQGSEDIASKAISAGVTDYLQKVPGTEYYDVLANHVTNAVAHSRTDQHRQEERPVIDHALDALDDLFYVIGPDGELCH